jgi:hypothetical protein
VPSPVSRLPVLHTMDKQPDWHRKPASHMLTGRRIVSRKLLAIGQPLITGLLTAVFQQFKRTPEGPSWEFSFLRIL